MVLISNLQKVRPLTNLSNTTLELLIKLLESKGGGFTDYKELTAALNSSFNILVTEEEILNHHKVEIEKEDLELIIKNCQIL